MPRHPSRSIVTKWSWCLLFLPLLAPAVLFWRNAHRAPRPVLCFEPLPVRPQRTSAYATDVAFSPDGRFIACAFAIEKGRKIIGGTPGGNMEIWSPAEIRLFDGRTGALHRSFTIASGPARSLVFSTGGKTLRALGEDGFVYDWDIHSGACLRRFTLGPKTTLVTSVHRRLAQAPPRTSPPFKASPVLLQDAKGRMLGAIPAATDYQNAAFSPDGQQFVLAGRGKSGSGTVVRFFGASDAKFRGAVEVDASAIFWMKFAGPNDLVGVDSAPFLMHGREKWRRFEKVDADFRCGTLSHDNTWLAAGGWEIAPPWQAKFEIDYRDEGDPRANFSYAAVWDVRTRKCLWKARPGGHNVDGIAVSPDKTRLAVVVSDTMHGDEVHLGHVEIWPLPGPAARL